MRPALHSLPMWQECRGNNQTSNRDKNQEQQAPSPRCSYRRLHTALPRLLSWPGPSHIQGTGQELEAGNRICYRGEERRGEGRRSSLKENSGVHNPSLHLAQLRWRGGKRGKEQRARLYPRTNYKRGPGGEEQRDGDGTQWLAVSVGRRWPATTSVQRAQGFCTPPLPHPTYTARKGGG